MAFKKLLFATAGIPSSTEPRNNSNGIRRVNELGLGGMEMAFVQSVYLTESTALEARKVAEENNVVLTTHGSFFINLNSKEKAKYYASINRIVKAAKIASIAGAFSVTFHAGFYQGISQEKTYSTIKGGLEAILTNLKENKINIRISPETTGKATQFGSLDELLQLSTELPIAPCIDFSHLHARSGGKENTYAEFRATFEKVEKALGSVGLKNMHCHLAGIMYSEKGERKHLMLKESDMNYKDLLKVFKEFDARGVIVCESPDPQVDALLLKKTFDKLD
jgi:deoxyribonuclease IV